MKPLVIVGFHKGMTTESFKTLRDYSNLTVEKSIPELYESGEWFLYTDVLYDIKPGPLYSNKKLKVIDKLEDGQLIKAVGYPQVMESPKVNTLFVRRAIEDIVYLCLYKHQWLCSLSLLEDKSYFKTWREGRMDMTLTLTKCKSLLEPFVDSMIQLETSYHNGSTSEIWCHQIFSEPQLLKTKLEAMGYSYRIPSASFNQSRIDSFNKRCEIRNTPEWKEIAAVIKSRR